MNYENEDADCPYYEYMSDSSDTTVVSLQRQLEAFKTHWQKRYQLDKNQKILILGEMDFSFALSIVRMLGSNHQIIATSYHGPQMNHNYHQNAKLL